MPWIITGVAILAWYYGYGGRRPGTPHRDQTWTVADIRNELVTNGVNTGPWLPNVAGAGRVGLGHL